ncbi:MAG: UDP-N-acetylmuramate dehydrogenase [Bacteroidetes bacterium]|nr:UDP-N-acetylmuramate dehydrogenase [Bacteroidota bacterium]
MNIEQNKSLKSFNTFGIEASAKYFTEVGSVESFSELFHHSIFQTEKKMILGGGSNILFTGDFDGLVIHNAIMGLQVISEGETQVLVKAGAGELWHKLVLWCIQNGYAGLENLSLIPGLVGAGPMQNIGAYGVEIKDVFYELEAISMKTGELVRFSLADCQFGYRESAFKNKYKNDFFITSVTLRLAKINSPRSTYTFRVDYGDIKATLAEMNIQNLSLEAVSHAVCKIRNHKLPNPKELGNAGSFFKNPTISKAAFDELIAKNPLIPNYPLADGSVKIPAGWLIEQCAWKGKVVGHTGSHKMQALVLVNYGGATGAEVWQLAQDIRQSVKDKFGIEISTEVNVV